MRKLFVIASIILMVLGLFSCETSTSVSKDIEVLRKERSAITAEVEHLNQTKSEYSVEVKKLQEELLVQNIYKSGKTPKYFLKLKLKQSHISLSITKHIKDGMNAIEFELPVDKEFYDTVSIGTSIVDEFRSGSFVLYGSFGSWEMTVVNKSIR